MILLFKMAPSHSAEAPSCVPTCQKLIVCGEKTSFLVFDKLPSDMCHSAVGHEFNVNESTKYIK